MAIGGVSRAAIAPDSCRLDGLVCARTVLDAQRGAIKRRCPRREPTHTRGKGSLLRAGLGLGWGWACFVSRKACATRLSPPAPATSRVVRVATNKLLFMHAAMTRDVGTAITGLVWFGLIWSIELLYTNLLDNGAGVCASTTAGRRHGRFRFFADTRHRCCLNLSRFGLQRGAVCGIPLAQVGVVEDPRFVRIRTNDGNQIQHFSRRVHALEKQELVPTCTV